MRLDVIVSTQSDSKLLIFHFNTPKFKAVVFLIFIHYNFWHFLFEYMKQGTNILLKLLLKSIDQTLAFRMSRVWKDCGRKAWRNKLHLIYNWMGIGASAIYLLFHSLRISNTEGSQLCNGSRCIFEAFFQYYENKNWVGISFS